MSPLRSTPGRTLVALGFLLLAVASSACDEDGKTAPDKCGDPALPAPFDIQTAGEPADDNAKFPCVTPIGHAVSSITPAGGNTTVITAGTGGGGIGGKASTGGSGGSAGSGGKGGGGKGSGGKGGGGIGGLGVSGLGGVGGL